MDVLKVLTGLKFFDNSHFNIQEANKELSTI